MTDMDSTGDGATSERSLEDYLGFAQVRDGKPPEGRKVEMPGPFNRSRVRKWLAAMDEEFAPVRSWLP